MASTLPTTWMEGGRRGKGGGSEGGRERGSKEMSYRAAAGTGIKEKMDEELHKIEGTVQKSDDRAKGHQRRTGISP